MKRPTPRVLKSSESNSGVIDVLTSNNLGTIPFQYKSFKYGNISFGMLYYFRKFLI